MFSFTYEDPYIEIAEIKKYLNMNNKNKLNSGLMILSGGCTMFDIAPYFQNLTAIDFNPKQIDWVKQKITLLNTDLYQDLLNSADFVFDKMFQSLKHKTFEDVFSRDNLIEKFGRQAIENTSDDFSSHFKSIYNSRGKYHRWIFDRDYSEKNKIYDIESIKKVKIVEDNFINYLRPNSYDFIQTSNITDWLRKQDFINFIPKLKLALKPNGILIMRRLLSDNILYSFRETNKSNAKY
jgi:hypothetical protein